MPIPAGPEGRTDVASTVLVLYEQLHDEVRRSIEDLGDAGLNWTPGSGANTIATIVTHMVGSEAETLRCVAGVSSRRDRDSEFIGKERGIGEVLAELRIADELIAELRLKISASRLRTFLALPSLPADERRSGLTWLVGSYGHAREHLGQIQLTRDLFRTRAIADESSIS